MYWKIGDKRTTVLTVPWHTIGNSMLLSVELVTEDDEDINDAYLFTPRPSCAGLLQARQGSDAAYMAVMGPFDANCFLGHVPARSRTAIDFLLDLPENSTEGYRIIPVMIGHGGMALASNTYFYREWPELWHEYWPVLFSDNF